MNATRGAGAAARMRADFDHRFTEPPPERQADRQALLTLWVGGDPYAIRASEISGLSARPPMTLMPGADPAYLGLSGRRGALLPVWDLAAAMGYPRALQTPWMVFSSAAPAWALAFERFGGYRLAPASAQVPAPAQGPRSPFSSQGIEIDGTLRPLLDLGQVLNAIQAKHPSNLKGNPS